MIVETQIINALKSIDLPPEVTLVLGDRSGVEPKAPYLLIQTISDWVNSLPRITHSHSTTNQTERVYQTEFHNFAFTFHDVANSRHHDWFKRFHRGLSSDFYQYAFEQQGLGIKDYDNIMYQPNPIDGVNYKRAIMNITFSIDVCEEFTVNTVKNVHIDGSLDYEDINDVDNVVVDIDYKI